MESAVPIVRTERIEVRILLPDIFDIAIPPAHPVHGFNRLANQPRANRSQPSSSVFGACQAARRGAGRSIQALVNGPRNSYILLQYSGPWLSYWIYPIR